MLKGKTLETTGSKAAAVHEHMSLFLGSYTCLQLHLKLMKQW